MKKIVALLITAGFAASNFSATPQAATAPAAANATETAKPVAEKVKKHKVSHKATKKDVAPAATATNTVK